MFVGMDMISFPGCLYCGDASHEKLVFVSDADLVVFVAAFGCF